MELALETKLSKKPVLEANDPIALTSEQQDKLDEHKVCIYVLVMVDL